MSTRSKPKRTEFIEKIRTTIATAIQCGRPTGYSPTEDEWYEIKKACDHLESQAEQLAEIQDNNRGHIAMIAQLEVELAAKDKVIVCLETLIEGMNHTLETLADNG